MRKLELERKTLQFKADTVDVEQGIFEGYASVFGNIDSGGDIVEPGAFADCIKDGVGRIKILALHKEEWLPIGVPLELREDDKGLYIKGKISNTSMGRDIKTLLRDGVLNEMSIGYDTLLSHYDGDGIRHLEKLDLLEVSLVTWAMNEKATVTGYKSLERSVQTIAQELALERKEGRKISEARLQTLEEASSTMKKAAKTLDALIQEVRAQPMKERASPLNRKARRSTIEIIF